MRALEPWMMDAVEAMCEGGFPPGLRIWLHRVHSFAASPVPGTVSVFWPMEMT